MGRPASPRPGPGATRLAVLPRTPRPTTPPGPGVRVLPERRRKSPRRLGVLGLIYAQQEERIRELEKDLLRATQLMHEDFLTGLLNRRGFERSFGLLSTRARRCGSSLSCVLIDLDDFKLLNDRHGHLAGDAGLQHFSEVLRSTVRSTDQVARIGGDEFALLLPDTSGMDAVFLIERIRKDLSRSPFSWERMRLSFDFSAAVKEIQGDVNLTKALSSIDRALREVKRGKKRSTLLV